MTNGSGRIEIREAVHADIESLTTLIPRSFAQDAPLNRLFPSDSLAIRQWWTSVYQKAIGLPTFQLLVAATGNTIIGLLTLHLWRSEFQTPVGSGICGLVPLTQDHDAALVVALHDQIEKRKQSMRQQPNYLIDIMAVDKEYQNSGIGKQLLQHACDIADKKKAAIFLQTSQARKYYLSVGLGFESREGDESGTVIRPSSVN